jgi:hypothetical protein
MFAALKIKVSLIDCLSIFYTLLENFSLIIEISLGGENLNPYTELMVF